MKKYLMILFILLIHEQSPAQEWIQQKSPTTKPIKKIFFATKTTVWIICDNDSVYKTTDGGKIWKGKYYNKSYNFNNIFFLNEYIGWVIGDNGIIIKTLDGGITWISQEGNTQFNLTGIIFKNNNYGWIVGYESSDIHARGIILKTTNSGNTWISIENSNILPLYGVYFYDTLRGWASGIVSASDLNSDGYIIHTTDGGMNWKNQKIPSGGGLKNIYFLNKEIGYSNGLMCASIRTTDGGEHWSAFQPNSILSVAFVGLSVLDTNRIYMADWEKVFTTTNGGKTWDDFKIVISSSVFSRISNICFFDSVNVWLSISNGQIWKLNSEINSVFIKKKRSSDCIMLTNYPNPFNPSTIIEYSIPNEEYVTLLVYDINGRIVGRLVDKILKPGTYKTVFENNGLPNGIYFYQLMAGEYREVRKMIILK